MMTTKNQKQSGLKKYLMWVAIVFGVIIVYSAIVGDDEGSRDIKTSIVGKWEPLLKKSNGGNTDIDWIEFFANGKCKLKDNNEHRNTIINNSNMVFDGTWKEKQKETSLGIETYIEIEYSYNIKYHKNIIAEFDMGKLGSAKKGDVVGTKEVTEGRTKKYTWDNKNNCDGSQFKKLK